MVDSLYDFQVGHLLFDTGWTLRFWSLLYSNLQVIGYYVVRISNFFIINSDVWGSDPVPHEQEASTVTKSVGDCNRANFWNSMHSAHHNIGLRIK